MNYKIYNAYNLYLNQTFMGGLINFIFLNWPKIFSTLKLAGTNIIIIMCFAPIVYVIESKKQISYHD